MVNLPGNRGSCWVATADRTGYPQLDSSVHAETVVVGGGIVGLTTALRLLEAGRSVILVEALEIGQQVTGRSTAKITTQHALIYRHLVDTCGLPTARNYTEANSAGVELIKDWIREYGIACDLECKNAYSYATNSKGREEIEAEAEAARQVGLQAEVLDRAPLPSRRSARFVLPTRRNSIRPNTLSDWRIPLRTGVAASSNTAARS